MPKEETPQVTVTDPVVRFFPNSQPQVEFFTSSEYEVLMGGAAGGGKTACLVIDPLRYTEYSDFTGIIFRRTFPELEGIMKETQKYYNAAGASYNDQKKIYTFPSGATIRLGYLEHKEDWRNYQGHENAYQGFDESTNLHWENIEMLGAWNRSRAPGIPAYRRLASNPGGISHVQHRMYFVEPCPAEPDGPRRWSEEAQMFWQPVRPGKTYFHTDPVTGRKLSRKFIPARVFDNIDLLKNNPNYLSQLLKLPTEKRRAYLEGDWYVFEGAFFDFRTDVHVIPPVHPYDMGIPPGSVRAGLDFGQTTVLEVAFRDWEGNIILFAEHYTHGLTIVERAEKMADFLEKNRLHKLFIIYDVNMEYKTDYMGHDRTPVQYFREVFYRRMGKNAPIMSVVSKKKQDDKFWRVACNESFKEYLHYELDENGKIKKAPKFRVTSDCPQFIRTVPELMHDPDSVGGMDFDQSIGEDHCYDAYKSIHMVLRTPERPQEKKKYTSYDEYMENEVFAKIHEKYGQPKTNWKRV